MMQFNTFKSVFQFNTLIAKNSRIYTQKIYGAKYTTSTSPPLDIIDPTHLKVNKTAQPKPMKPNKELLFGRDFTDHMLLVDWTKSDGWKSPRIVPYGPLSFEPSISALHYSMECFEGMKAYKDESGRIRLFRPDKNLERLTNSAKRIALPYFKPEGFMTCLKELLKVDEKWVPQEHGYSLYIRPTLIGTQNTLGVGPSNSALLFVICSPVGPYYPEGWKAVKLLGEDRYVRAWPGGTGEAKLGGNYSPTILPQIEAAKQGYTQILWLFGPQGEVTEAGTMNFFMYWINKEGQRELITPPLDGTILPGVTRDSILQLAKQWKEFKVVEKKFTIHDVVEAVEQNRVLEAFGAGTAAVVSPVKLIGFRGKDYAIPLDKDDPSAPIGKLTKRFADTIMGIQYGEIQSPWSVPI